ncbi:Hsp70 family protein [Streptomyces sp. NPDC058221]|uniref:Hsp70 family protein n=1 Tax=Streptomyces sp. NPDC058221 TaxID=3346388 RepID=UPI0036EF76DF
MTPLGRLGMGPQQRLKRAVNRLRTAFDASPPLTGKESERAARDYGAALRLAVEQEPPLAAHLLRDYDSRIPSDHYPLAFGPKDATWLAGLAERDDRHVLTVAFELGVRLRLDEVRSRARDRMADLLGRERDADRLVSYLQRCKDVGLLDADTVTRAVRGHLVNVALSRDTQLWSAFFDQLPEALLPELCEVHCFLGRGADAVRLADTNALRRQALDCCARSPRLDDVRAGLGLAHGRADTEAAQRLEERAGDLLFDAGEFTQALTSFEAAGRPDRASECLERLGRIHDALDACPADRAERVGRLVGLCRPEVDALVEQGEFTEAARTAKELTGHLDRAALDSAELTATRAAVAAEGRQHFRSLLARAEAPSEQQAVLARWSRFEEESGEPAQAARRAAEGGDRYRAHRLYRSAGRFGEADLVLRHDETPEGLTARAEARESGGDLLGAARLYADAGEQEPALDLFMRAGAYGMAADSLLRWHGDRAMDDPRLAECLLRSGRFEELVRLYAQAVESGDRRDGLADELHGLRHNPALPPSLAPGIDRALDALDGTVRRRFEERAQAWVAQARAETDRRYAGIWGLDLGTTTCAAAVYDTEAGKLVLCPWKGRTHFASTLSLDRQGNELVGLADEEILADWVVGHISASKRAMGTRTVYRIRDRSYRPEEVAARLIRHARGLVEGYLATRVRERVGELAQAELGRVREDWLSWAERHHDLRLDRPRVVLTIPAYFLNNQKHATRDACRIAGVDVVRLIHEPTAACITATRERRLSGRVCVVDLGAGTLDACVVEVEDNVHDVHQVLGDTHYGGKDFDASVSRALAERLKRQGIDVPEKGVARRRLEVAAEYLKIGLSSQEHTDYALHSFIEGKDVNLELGRAELADILEQPLRTLRRTCAEFKESLDSQPAHLVLVGGPMLSPLVRETVEEVFGRKRTVVADPRTAVACGAALQGAVLDGSLRDLLLLDVTPLPLGISVLDEEQQQVLSTLIQRNMTIPTVGRDVFTTTRDNQSAVRIEVFNGQLDAKSRIGQILLEGIPPAPAGVPKIEVQFSIDASCVLEVTARDQGTGQSKSIRVTDSTLLSPNEVDDMTHRHELQAELADLRKRLRSMADEAEAGDGEVAWRELRQRLSAYRPSQAPTDPETQRMLGEIFNEANDREVELLLTEEPLRDLAAKAREYLNRTMGPAGAEPGSTPDQDLAEARHLAAELGGLLDRLRPQLARLTAWNALLVRLATAEPDPLRRFRTAHDSGEYARALAALSGLSAPLESPEDLRRQLRSLAEVGDADGYRDALAAHAGRLGAVLLDPERPDLFLERFRSALVTVTGQAAGSGFLISDRLVVTNRHLLPDDGRAEAGVEVRVEGMGTRAVERVFLPDSRRSDVAVLRLADPVAPETAVPLRLGHAKLLGIGDRVWAAGPPPRDLLHGVVDRFESFPEQDLRLFRTGLRLPPRCSGGPLLNDLGEAVGILTIGEGGATGDGLFALTADALAPLLDSAGFDGV